jgi:MFS family permease
MGGVVILLALFPHLATFLYRMSYSQLALPLYASGPAGMDPSFVGLLLGSQAMIAVAMLGPAGWMTNRFGVRPVLAGSLLLASTGVALTPVLPPPFGLWIAVGLFGAGLAIMGVASGLFIFTLAGYSTAMLVSMYRLSGDLMQVLGPMAVGPILEAIGFEWTFYGLAACGLLALLSLGIRGRGAKDEST